MSDFLIRKLPKQTLEQAKRMAAKHHRSLQEEISSILVEAFRFRTGAWARRADLILQKTSPAGRRHSDSVALIREDRNR